MSQRGVLERVGGIGRVERRKKGKEKGEKTHRKRVEVKQTKKIIVTKAEQPLVFVVKSQTKIKSQNRKKPEQFKNRVKYISEANAYLREFP